MTCHDKHSSLSWCCSGCCVLKEHSLTPDGQGLVHSSSFGRSALSWIHCGWSPWLVFWHTKGRRCLTISWWAWLCIGHLPRYMAVAALDLMEWVLIFSLEISRRSLPMSHTHHGGCWSLAGTWRVWWSNGTCRQKRWCWMMLAGGTLLVSKL